jgi:hypothetical protein
MVAKLRAKVDRLMVVLAEIDGILASRSGKKNEDDEMSKNSPDFSTVDDFSIHFIEAG